MTLRKVLILVGKCRTLVTQMRTSCGPHQTAVRQIVLQKLRFETRQRQELVILIKPVFSLCYRCCPHGGLYGKIEYKEETPR